MCGWTNHSSSNENPRGENRVRNEPQVWGIKSCCLTKYCTIKFHIILQSNCSHSDYESKVIKNSCCVEGAFRDQCRDRKWLMFAPSYELLIKWLKWRQLYLYTVPCHDHCSVGIPLDQYNSSRELIPLLPSETPQPLCCWCSGLILFYSTASNCSISQNFWRYNSYLWYVINRDISVIQHVRSYSISSGLSHHGGWAWWSYLNENVALPL